MIEKRAQTIKTKLHVLKPRAQSETIAEHAPLRNGEFQA
jgi:hypothetical protein